MSFLAVRSDIDCAADWSEVSVGRKAGGKQRTSEPNGCPGADWRRSSHEPEDGEDRGLEVKEGCADEVHLGGGDRGEEEGVPATLFAALRVVDVDREDEAGVVDEAGTEGEDDEH